MSDEITVPVWEKYIGENKLRRIISEDKDASFVLWNGNRPQIKRVIFERYLDKQSEI